jgi:hypothetical protein
MGSPARSTGQARHVQALLAFRHGTAENDVLDLRGVEAFGARDRFANHHAASSSGRVLRSVPLKALPTGVRTAEMMYASLIPFFMLATPR